MSIRQFAVITYLSALALALSACIGTQTSQVGVVRLNLLSVAFKTPDGNPYTGSARLCFDLGAASTNGFGNDTSSSTVTECREVLVDHGEIAPLHVEYPISTDSDHASSELLYNWGDGWSGNGNGHLAPASGTVDLKGMTIQAKIDFKANGEGYFVRGKYKQIRDAASCVGQDYFNSTFEDGCDDLFETWDDFEYVIDAHALVTVIYDNGGLLTNTVDAVLMTDVMYEGKPLLSFTAQEGLAGADDEAKQRADALCRMLRYEVSVPGFTYSDRSNSSEPVTVVDPSSGRFVTTEQSNFYNVSGQQWIHFAYFHDLACKRAIPEGGKWKDTGPRRFADVLKEAELN